MVRRIFIIGVLVLVTVLFGAFVWFAFFAPAPLPKEIPQGVPPTSTPFPISPPFQPGSQPVETSPSSGTLPSSPPVLSIVSATPPSRSKLRTLVPGPVAHVVLNSEGTEILYWDRRDKRFWRVAPEGTPALVSSHEFPAVSKAIFSPDRSRAILITPDGATILYEFNSSYQTTLPRAWRDISFSPDGTKIVLKYIGGASADRFLMTALPNGEGSEVVTTLGATSERVFSLWSPAGDIITLFTEHRAQDELNLFFVGAHEENFRSVVVPGLTFHPQWSPQGTHLLFDTSSALTSYSPSVWLMGATPASLGARMTDLNLATFVSMCTFSAEETNVYCAVPDSLPEGASLIPEVAQGLRSSLYRVDIQTGVKTLLLNSSSLSVEKILISADEHTLFMLDDQGALSALTL